MTTLRGLRRALGKRRSVEYIVVTDGNTDGSEKRLLTFARSHRDVRILRAEHRLGKGAAVARGIRNAHGTIVAFIDGDESIDPAFLPSLLDVLQRRRFHIVVGNRTRYDTSWVRRCTNRIYRFLTVMLFRPSVHDTQAGIKMFQGAIAKELFRELRIKGYAFDIDILALAAAHGCRIAEVPVRQRLHQHSSMTPAAALHMAMDTLVVYHHKLMTDVRRTLKGKRHEHADIFSIRHVILYPLSLIALLMLWPVRMAVPREHS